MRALRPLATRLAALRFLRLAIPFMACVPAFRSRRLQDASARRPGISSRSPPSGYEGMEAARPPKFLGDPLSHLPCSRTPAGPPHQVITTLRCCPCIVNCKDSRALLLSRLNRTAFAIAVYASWVGSPQHARKTRFWLLTGLCQIGLATNRVTLKGFGLWSSSFPKLYLAR